LLKNALQIGQFFTRYAVFSKNQIVADVGQIIMTENGSKELDSLVLTNNKPENLSSSENAIIITIEKYFKRFNYAIGIVITKLG
jgi:hypothetical protein